MLRNVEANKMASREWAEEVYRDRRRYQVDGTEDDNDTVGTVTGWI